MFITLIVTLASIFTFTFTLAPRFKGLTSTLIFLVIPLAYFLVYLYVHKKANKVYHLVNTNIQFRFDLIKQVLVYIVILLMVFFIFLMSLYFPLEKRGINNTPLNLTIQPYLLNESLNQYNESILIQANKIYGQYNISVKLLPTKMINVKLNDSDKRLIFVQQNCSKIDELFNLTDYQDTKIVKLILLDYNGSTNGMANICGRSNLIFMAVNNSMPYWVLAHETGHILSAKIECWKFNLMKEYSSECYGANWVTHNFIRELRPDFLNQKQVSAIVNSIETRFS